MQSKHCTIGTHQTDSSDRVTSTKLLAKRPRLLPPAHTPWIGPEIKERTATTKDTPKIAIRRLLYERHCQTAVGQVRLHATMPLSVAQKPSLQSPNLHFTCSHRQLYICSFQCSPFDNLPFEFQQSPKTLFWKEPGPLERSRPHHL